MAREFGHRSGDTLETKKSRAEATVIRVESRFNPDSKITCPFDSNPTEQRQIDYSIVINNQRFVVPGVWASVCPEDGQAFFAPEVSKAVMDKIFAIQHPKGALWGKLMEGEIPEEDIRELLAGSSSG